MKTFRELGVSTPTKDDLLAWQDADGTAGVDLVKKITFEAAAIASGAAVPHVATVAALRAGDFTGTNLLWLDEYASGTGKGGGPLERLTDGSDDGGTIFVDNVGGIWGRPSGWRLGNVLFFGAVADSDGAGGGTDDSGAINAALAVYSSVLAPAGSYRLSSPINPGSAIDKRFFGEGQGATIFYADDGVDAIVLTNQWGRIKISDMQVRTAGTVGARAAGRGVVFGQSLQSYNASLERMIIDTADQAVYGRNLFTFEMSHCIGSSDNEHIFDLGGGNTTLLKMCYAQSVRTALKAGYRIRSQATLLACNGLNEGDIWGAFGGTVGADAVMGEADGAAQPAYVQLIGCNIEDFAKIGVYAKGTVRFIPIINSTMFAPSSGTFDCYIQTGSAAEAAARGITLQGVVTTSKGATRNLDGDIVTGGFCPVLQLQNDSMSLYRSDQSLSYANTRIGVKGTRFATLGVTMEDIIAERTLLLEPQAAAPIVPVDGTMYRANGSAHDPGSGAGIYSVESGEKAPMWAHKLAVDLELTSDGAITALQCDGRRVTNTGASGTVTATLPLATVGRHLFVVRTASQIFRLDPNGAQIIGSGGAGKYLELGSDNAYVELLCIVDGQWAVRASGGTVTYEP